MEKELVKKALQHGSLLTEERPEYRNWVLTFLLWQFVQDKRQGDLTVESLFPTPTPPMTLDIIAKEDGLIAGLEELTILCDSQGIRLKTNCEDGSFIKKEMCVVSLIGTVEKILSIERVALDLLGRMSGIASMTQRFVKQVKGDIEIAATRKTLWGLLDKKGVFVGGGLTHRLGLWQAYLVKDNHIAALHNLGFEVPFDEVFRRVLSHKADNKVPFFEIEVETTEQVLQIAETLKNNSTLAFPFIMLLDNFSPPQIKEAIESLNRVGLRDKVIIEISGGVSEENLSQYVGLGGDLMSIGSLTHSVHMFDFSAKLAHSTLRSK